MRHISKVIFQKCNLSKAEKNSAIISTIETNQLYI